jgi:hypothetical protein
MLTTGTITEVDLARGIFTLHDGREFILPPLFQYTSFPVLGQKVEILFADEGGQNVTRSIHTSQRGRGR